MIVTSVPVMTEIHPTPPSSASNASPKSLANSVSRHSLPDKNVTSESIENAYVAFILYCNPAVPVETDTTALREGFRVPPRSDGKAFSTFTLFELIRMLNTKELKTWADLAMKLGVTPPDTGQSSQKIQQYAVRLKRWMHSMHIDAFFDYLQGNDHPYWTQIPTGTNPLHAEGRDGVAAEDDMALRSLLPHIRPRRGRRKPEDDLNKSPSQRPRMDSPSLGDSRQNVSEPWTAHPDGQRAFLFPTSEEARSSILPGTGSTFPWPSELSQTPMTAYPQSAMTPINGRGFWADEPRSAITPMKMRPMGRRHGAKVVSSAWRSGGSGSTGKTRGRPPLQRSTDTPLSAVPDGDSTNPFGRDTPQSAHPTSAMAQSVSGAPTSAPTSGPTSAPTSVPTPTSAGPHSSRPGRPSGLSLQVPERQGGNVRLATPPPPVLMVNGQSTPSGTDPNEMSNSALTQDADISSAASTHYTGRKSLSTTPVGGMHKPPSSAATAAAESTTQQQQQDENMINVREVESLFVSELLVADWVDGQTGNSIPPCGVEEAEAVARTTIGNMQKQALTPEAFLINLSALAGGSILQRGVRALITRTTDNVDSNSSSRYTCKWGLRYGAFRGSFSMTETVPHAAWQKKPAAVDAGDGDLAAAEARHWKSKYEELLRAVKADHERSTDLRLGVLGSLKGSHGQ